VRVFLRQKWTRHRSSRHQMTPCLLTEESSSSPPQSAWPRVRFGSVAKVRHVQPYALSIWVMFFGFRPVHPATSGLRLTSYVLDPVSPASHNLQQPPGSTKRGPAYDCWLGVPFRATHAGACYRAEYGGAWDRGI